MRIPLASWARILHNMYIYNIDVVYYSVSSSFVFVRASFFVSAFRDYRVKETIGERKEGRRPNNETASFLIHR